MTDQWEGYFEAWAEHEEGEWQRRIEDVAAQMMTARLTHASTPVSLVANQAVVYFDIAEAWAAEARRRRGEKK